MPAPTTAGHRVTTFLALVGVCGLAGCSSSPLAVQSERDLRRTVIDSVRREISQSQSFPAIRTTERDAGLNRLEITPELIPELERMAGPNSYTPALPAMDTDLLGQAQQYAPISLAQAISSALQRNLSLQFARLQPSIAEAQVVAAQAAFDATFFSNLDWSNLDQPRATTRQGNQTFGVNTDQRTTFANAAGIRRTLPSGGQFTLQQDINYSDVNTDGQGQVPNPAVELAWTLRFDQPMLRGFGTDVTMAQVRVNRNAERDQIASLKRDLIRTANDTERTYWQLVQAVQDLAILQRLYERGVTVRDLVRAREDIDASTPQKADANSRVETRLSNVIRAQNALRAASDSLKVLINDPDAPIGSEVLLLPVDRPVDAAVSFSLADALSSAVQNRPELQQAILSIDNTSIRQQVADNARLPRLDLRLQTRIAGQQNDLGEAINDAADGAFIDYLIGIQFEQPIGNRAAEAGYRQRRQERKQATIAYANAVQMVFQEVKRSLRLIVTNYKLIEQTRTARYAETLNLRSFQAEMQFVRGQDVQTLDLEFRRQESLAQAERDEVQALADFNIAVAQFYAAIGTALERNNIEFRVPDADAALELGGLHNPDSNPVVSPKAATPLVAPKATPGPIDRWRERRSP
ncbi:MAG: TolC family protein [Phycisphaerales bacterium]